LNRNINVGAYGWRHSHWLNGFYPDDLPMADEDDWRLAYYSNEFTTVMVPADYWPVSDEQTQRVDCERWLEDVNEDFQFLVECHAELFEQVSFAEISKQLTILQPQLSAIVLRDNKQALPDSVCKQLCDIAEALEVNIYTDNNVASNDVSRIEDTQIKSVWQQKTQHISDLTLFEDELTDLRLTRTIVDQFVSQLSEAEKSSAAGTIIVDHPNLLTENLNQFRAVLDIMGH